MYANFVRIYKNALDSPGNGCESGRTAWQVSGIVESPRGLNKERDFKNSDLGMSVRYSIDLKSNNSSFVKTPRHNVMAFGVADRKT
jgi:hypothetical protein